DLRRLVAKSEQLEAIEGGERGERDRAHADRDQQLDERVAALIALPPAQPSCGIGQEHVPVLQRYVTPFSVRVPFLWNVTVTSTLVLLIEGVVAVTFHVRVK